MITRRDLIQKGMALTGALSLWDWAKPLFKKGYPRRMAPDWTAMFTVKITDIRGMELLSSGTNPGDTLHLESNGTITLRTKEGRVVKTSKPIAADEWYDIRATFNEDPKVSAIKKPPKSFWNTTPIKGSGWSLD